MAKQTGLGDNLYVAGYDLSGDIGAVQAINSTRNLLNFTGLNKSAMERGLGLRDGEISFNNIFFNDAADQSHLVLRALQAGADVHLMYAKGQAIGNQAACLVAKQASYNLVRGADASLLGDVQGMSSGGFGLDWCHQLSAGKATTTGAENLASVDLGFVPGSVGLVAYLQVFGFTGTDITFTIEESSDDGSGDAWAGVTGGAFTQVTAANQQERIATSVTQAVERYLRLAITGTFTSVDYAAAVFVSPINLT